MQTKLPLCLCIIFNASLYRGFNQQLNQQLKLQKMLGAIKRVISGDNMLNLDPPEAATGGVVGESMNDNSGTPTSTVSAPPALVENDQYMDVDPGVTVTHIASTALDTPGSSISDLSDGHLAAMHRWVDQEGDINMQNEGIFQPRIFPMRLSNSIPEQAAANFPRNDSIVSSSDSSESNSMRGGSQNSSRDWGWFEDVYTSDHNLTPQLKRKETSENDKNNKKKGKKRSSLVPLGNDENSEEIIHSILENGTLTVFLSRRRIVCGGVLFMFLFSLSDIGSGDEARFSICHVADGVLARACSYPLCSVFFPCFFVENSFVCVVFLGSSMLYAKPFWRMPKSFLAEASGMNEVSNLDSNSLSLNIGMTLVNEQQGVLFENVFFSSGVVWLPCSLWIFCPPRILWVRSHNDVFVTLFCLFVIFRRSSHGSHRPNICA